MNPISGNLPFHQEQIMLVIRNGILHPYLRMQEMSCIAQISKAFCALMDKVWDYSKHSLKNRIFVANYFVSEMSKLSGIDGLKLIRDAINQSLGKNALEEKIQFLAQGLFSTSLNWEITTRANMFSILEMKHTLKFYQKLSPNLIEKMPLALPKIQETISLSLSLDKEDKLALTLTKQNLVKQVLKKKNFNENLLSTAMVYLEIALKPFLDKIREKEHISSADISFIQYDILEFLLKTYSISELKEMTEFLQDPICASSNQKTPEFLAKIAIELNPKITNSIEKIKKQLENERQKEDQDWLDDWILQSVIESSLTDV